MTTKAGIWIDRKHAIAVRIDGANQEVKEFEAGDNETFPASKESRAQHTYTPNDFVAEDKLERKKDAVRRGMYDDLLHYLTDVKTILVLGPGEAKGEFVKRLHEKATANTVVQAETADKMTVPQLVAKIREHFQAAN